MNDVARCLGLLLGLTVAACGSRHDEDRGHAYSTGGEHHAHPHGHGHPRGYAEGPHGRGPHGGPHGHGRFAGGGPHGPGQMATCPMQIEGLTYTAEDVPRGAALSFRTETGDVAELQDQVQQMADMHNRRRGNQPMGRRGPMAPNMHAAEARVEELPDGARLVFTSPSEDVDALRDEVRAHAERMQAGGCPRMAGRPA